MELKVHIDPGAKGVTVTVTAPAENDEVKALRALLAPYEPIPGWQGERVTPLNAGEVLQFYGRDKGVFAQTAEGEYQLKLRLYELEERLDSRTFVRISNSEIVNLKQVTALDLSLGGTIKMTLAGGKAVCWVSRRNVKNIKKALGL